MKITKFFTVLFACTLLISCSTDDDDGNNLPVDQNSLIGTWSMSSLNANTELSGTLAGLPFTGNLESVGENLNYTITFTETGYTAQGSYDIVTNGTINDIPVDEDISSVMDANESGTYTFENDILTIDGELYDLEAGELPEGVSLDQDITVSFDENGNLIMEQQVETTIETGLAPIGVAVDSRLVWTRN